MGTIDDDEVALKVSLVGDYDPGADATVQVPREAPPGIPLDLVETVAWNHSADDGVPDYANAAVLRAGDSAQTSVIVTGDGGQPPDLPGCGDSGSAGGDAGGD